MAKRKITKFCSAKLCHSINSLFRPLCPSDISPCKRETKQKIPPLTKGGLGGVCAFTLVELIVVVTILAILGTIAFISLQNYARDARDVKRVSEMKQLFTKIEIEHTKGVLYADLINVLDPDTDCHTGNVLGQNVKICQGPANFGAINENQDNFKDGGNDYIFAYTAPVTVQGGDGTSRNMEFLQGATTLENGTNKVVGNYYTENEDDTLGLVLDTDGEPITDGGNGNVSTPPENTDEENPPTTYNNCTAPQIIGNYTITENKNHSETLIATRTGTLSSGNGYSNYEQQFKCNDGTFEEDGEEEQQPPTCNDNYLAQGTSGNYECVSDTCTGNLPDNAISNGTISYGTWTYNETAGICKFKCNDGYDYTSGTNTCNPKTKTITSATHNSKTFTFTSFTLAYGTPQTKTSSALSITNGTSTLTATFTLGSDGTTVTLSNTNEAITCNGGYYQQDGTTICTEVGYGYYSATGSSTRTQCSSGYTTTTTTSSSSSNCTSTTQETTCGGSIPENTAVNTPSSKTTYTQTLIPPSTWSPSSKNWSYNTTSGECNYTCSTNYHTENSGISCVSNTRSCTISNGAGQQTWGGSSWGTCSAISCNSGYTISGNTCISLPSAGGATVVPSNGHYRAKPTQIQMDAMNTEYQTYGTTYTACNYSLGVYWCHWTMSTSNGGCRGWEATTISSSNLGIVNGTTIEGVNIPFSSNSYQIDGGCGPIGKYPAMKICQNMGAGWKLPTIFELGQICYDSNSCSSIRNVLSLEPQWHWSSTEYSAGYARILNMNSGDVSNSDKESNLYVICYHD